jgi:glycosyltransferase involved in cell wall biosynthesis
MKICLVADRLPGFHEKWSGAEHLCMRLSQMLVKEGHEVTFFVTKSEEENIPDSIYEIPTPMKRLGVFSNIFPLDLFTLYSSIRFLKVLKPDVVHLHSQALFLPALLGTVLDPFILCPETTLRRPDGKICNTYQGLECVDCSRPSRNPLRIWGRKIIFYRRFLIYNFLLKRLDAIITLSKTSKSRLEQYGLTADRIKVIYHYEVDTSTNGKIPAMQLQPPTLLFVGWLNELRGLHVLIEAMSHIVDQVPDSRLIVVGSEEDTHYVAKIKAMIEDLGLGESVQITGKRENEEVIQLIARSDAVVVPLQWPNEFGPLILVEAMSLSKPVIASRIGGTPEFVEDGFNGFLVAHDRPGEFADKATCLLKDRDLARSMGENARKSVESLYNENPARRIVELYRSFYRT